MVWDRLTATHDGEYAVECLWQTLGEVKLMGRGLAVEQDGETFSLYNADGSALSLSYRGCLYQPDREAYSSYEHARDGYMRVLRQSQRRQMKQGDQVEFLNLMQITTGKSPLRLTRIDENLVRIEGRNKMLVGLRDAKVGPLEIRAKMFVIDSSGVQVTSGSNISWQGRSVWESKRSESGSINIPDAEAVLSVPTAEPSLSAQSASPSVVSRVITPEWKISLGAQISAMCLAGGTIAAGDKRGMVHLYNYRGKKKTSLAAESGISVVSILPRGLIAFGARDGSLALAKPNGDILWMKHFGHGIAQRLRVPTALLPFEDGLIVGLEEGTVFRLDLNGKELWHARAYAHAITKIGLIDVSGRPQLMIGTEYYTMNLFDAKGNRLWVKQFGPATALTAADLDGDGQAEILYAEWMGIHALRPGDGLVMWSVNMGGEVLDVVPVKSSGDDEMEVYTASDIGQVALVHPDGRIGWRLDAGERLTSMAVGHETMALGCLSGHVQIRELRGGRLRSQAKMESTIFKLSALDGRTEKLIGATEDGTLFAM